MKRPPRPLAVPLLLSLVALLFGLATVPAAEVPKWTIFDDDNGTKHEFELDPGKQAWPIDQLGTLLLPADIESLKLVDEKASELLNTALGTTLGEGRESLNGKLLFVIHKLKISGANIGELKIVMRLKTVSVEGSDGSKSPRKVITKAAVYGSSRVPGSVPTGCIYPRTHPKGSLHRTIKYPMGLREWTEFIERCALDLGQWGPEDLQRVEYVKESDVVVEVMKPTVE
ncbi:hypothetical protein [Verrucomicrobium sp. BvORR106]|uniref:hypothetical protein n=1 Tax=Verrucomicrobium sp. BvORR106 TaxID=1403819 RepID=UPI00056E6142|nr:hypothetical protein [Verrucomicrobium sp. BvORR106]